MKKVVISHLIRPEDLQHHGTLFAGRMAEQFVETCFLAAARFTGKPDNVVCVQIHGIHFNKPASNGDIIEIISNVAYAEKKSITVSGKAVINDETVSSVTGMITFVTVDKDGKPYEHGLKLTDDYISQNREIYEEALKIRG